MDEIFEYVNVDKIKKYKIKENQWKDINPFFCYFNDMKITEEYSVLTGRAGFTIPNKELSFMKMLLTYRQETVRL